MSQSGCPLSLRDGIGLPETRDMDDIAAIHRVEPSDGPATDFGMEQAPPPLHGDPVRILHTITDLEMGGAEMMLLRLLAAADRRRVDGRVLSLMPPGPLDRPFRDHAEVESLGMARSAPRLRHLVRLARMARRSAADVHQGWMYHGNLAATALHAMQRRPSSLVWSVHHSLTDIRNEKPLSQRLIGLSARLSRRAAAIIYVSSVSAQQHEAIGFDPSRRIIIPNGVDTDLFRPDGVAADRLRQATGAPSGRALVGMIARINPSKDHPRLIRAAGEVVRRGGDLQLVLIGDGVDPSDAAIAAALGDAALGDRISFLGLRDDVPSLMAGFDLLVTPSAYGEAFPVVVAEAMAAGVPCIATDLGDCAMLIGGTGSIIPPRDTAALVAALEQWLGRSADERRAAGAAARARIVANFTLQAVARRYEALYASLHARRACR